MSDEELDELVVKAIDELGTFESLVVWKRRGVWQLVWRLHDLICTHYFDLATITEEQARRLHREHGLHDLYGQLAGE